MSLFPQRAFFRQCVVLKVNSNLFNSEQFLGICATFKSVKLRHDDSSVKNKSLSLQTVKPIKVTPRQHFSEMELSRYPLHKCRRQEAQNTQHAFLGDDDEIYEDELAEKVDRYSTKFKAVEAEAQFTQSILRDLQTVKRYTIKQKYFKPPPTPNLLTWAAKEQIRHLHKYEAWSIPALSETFPASNKTVKEILKSKQAMFQPEDIFRHDRHVMENWEKLHSQFQSTYYFPQLLKHFFNPMNKCVITFAVGHPGLPQPANWEPRNVYKKEGPISSIVQDCFNIQEQEAKLLLEEKIPALSQEILSKLKEMSLLVKTIQRALLKKEKKRKTVAELSKTETQDRKSDRLKGTFSDKSVLEVKQNEFPGNLKKISYNETYISGKSVYDEDGDFLYKIP